MTIPDFKKSATRKATSRGFGIRHRNSRGDWEWGAGSADTSVLYRRDEIDEEIALGGGGGDMDDAIPF